MYVYVCVEGGYNLYVGPKTSVKRIKLGNTQAVNINLDPTSRGKESAELKPIPWFVVL